MKNILALISSSRETFTAARAQLIRLDSQIVALRVRRSCIAEAPLTEADYVAAMSKHVRARAAGFADEMVRFHSARRMDGYSAEKAGTKDFPYDLFTSGAGSGHVIPAHAACFYFEDAIVAGVKRLAGLMAWPDDAIGREQRAELLKAADAELAELAASRNALAEAMGEGADVAGAMSEGAILSRRIAAIQRDNPALSEVEARDLAESGRDLS